MNRFLGKCLEIEETAARIYQTFHQTVVCDGDLKNIWRRMALDEEDHAHQIRLAQSLLRENILSPGRMAEGQLDQLLNRIRDIAAGIKTGTMSIEDALRVSMKLEEDFTLIHVNVAFKIKQPKMRRLFQLLARADEDHAEEIRDYYRRHFESLRWGTVTVPRSSVTADAQIAL